MQESNKEISEIHSICNDIKSKFETLYNEFKLPVTLGVPTSDSNFREAFTWINYNLDKIIQELSLRKDLPTFEEDS